MRPTLFILVMAIFVVIPAMVLSDSIYERETEDRSAASRIGTEFIWPENPLAAKPDDALRILTEAADAVGVNIIRTSVDTTDASRARIIHHIYLADDGSRLFDQFELADGRWLNRDESRTGSAIVSSMSNGQGTIVGIPNVLADAYELTLAPFHVAFDSLPATGQYIIETQNDATTDDFLTAVSQRLVKMGMKDLTAESLLYDDSRTTTLSPFNLQFAPFALIPVIAILVVSILLRDGKSVGVMRLSGHSTARIWFCVVGKLQLVSCLIGLLACMAVLVFVPGVDTPFAWTVGRALLPITVIGIGLTLIVGITTIKRIQVSDLIKGRLQ